MSRLQPLEPEGEGLPPTPPRRGGPAALLGLLLVGVALGAGGMYLVERPRSAGAGGAADRTTPAAAETWQCPMHPAVVRDHADTCPICGMNLVKVEAAAPAPAPGGAGDQPVADGIPGLHPPPLPAGLAEVQLDARRQQLIGLNTAEATVGPISGTWRTSGRVAIDETRVRRINVKVAGFVEHVYVDFVGKQVRMGDPLFALFSPELVAAQDEYLLALRTRDTLAARGAPVEDGEALVAAARRKLALWDVPSAEIDRLATAGEPTRTLTLRSPVSGVVTRKDVVEGMRLEAGAMPYEVVDLSRVWVLADVTEAELRFLEPGVAATLQLNAYPDRSFQGTVVFVDPVLDAATRTAKARLVFPNPRGDLRPEMFGEVVLRGPQRQALRIAHDAVIDSGTERMVFVSLGEGRFQPRTVQLGARDGDVVEVLGGLAAGERVVTRANFLIDSESRLRSALAALAAGSPPVGERAPAGGPPGPSGPGAPSAPSTPPDHAGHSR